MDVSIQVGSGLGFLFRIGTVVEFPAEPAAGELAAERCSAFLPGQDSERCLTCGDEHGSGVQSSMPGPSSTTGIALGIQKASSTTSCNLAHCKEAQRP